MNDDSKADASVSITARPAEAADAHYVWTVNNDSAVRAQAVNQGDISWESHRSWYDSQLLRSDGKLLIGLRQGQAVGVARFDVVGDEAIVTIAVGHEHRGRGAGQGLISVVTTEAFARREVRVSVAYIRPTNLASQRAFLNNRYVLVGPRSFPQGTMLRFEKIREDA